MQQGLELQETQEMMQEMEDCSTAYLKKYVLPTDRPTDRQLHYKIFVFVVLFCEREAFTITAVFVFVFVFVFVAICCEREAVTITAVFVFVFVVICFERERQLP